MTKKGWDDVTPGRRNNMVANRSKNTKPELAIRSALHRLGYRFRLHRAELPGKPDIVFPGRRKIVEVRGCFWHGHACRLGQLPRARQDYWLPKIARTKERDGDNVCALMSLGWEVLEIWECEVRDAGSDLESRLVKFLGPAKAGRSADR